MAHAFDVAGISEQAVFDLSNTRAIVRRLPSFQKAFALISRGAPNFLATLRKCWLAGRRYAAECSWISSSDELEELWAIDNSAYGAASITFEKFLDWWRAYPQGLLVLHGDKRIAGAIGMWPISESAAERLRNSHLKESDLTGEMMQPFRYAPARRWYIPGIVLRPELVGTRAIRVLLGDGLCHWLYTAAIASPFQLLALASLHEGELLLARFGFYCYQRAHAMPDGAALFALDSTREEFISLLQRRGIHSLKS
jgi:hypothetical protein